MGVHLLGPYLLKPLSIKIIGHLSVKVLICKNGGWPLSVISPYL